MRGKQHLITIISSLFSLVVLVWVAVRLDWAQIGQVLTELQVGWLFLGFFFYVLTYIFRTLRFQILIYTQSVSLPALFGITCLYGFFTYFLPAKSGELSYPLLLKRYRHVSLSEGTATLFTARFFDFATVACFLPVILLVFWSTLPDWLKGAAIIFCLLVYGAVGVMTYLLQQSREMVVQPHLSSWKRNLHSGWAQLVKGIQIIHERGGYGRIWILTVVIWLCTYANLFFIIYSLGYRPTYFQIIVASMILIPLTLLPVQGFANLGTHEIGLVTAFQLFGYSLTHSVTVATSSHLLLLLFVLLLGCLGWLIVAGLSGAVTPRQNVQQIEEEPR